MINWFKKKDKIEFFSYVQGVASACPVLPAKSNLPSWVNQARQDFKVQAVATDKKFTHLYRCPGVFEILGEGYLITLPWDIIIETRGDDWDFKWTVPDAELTNLMGGEIQLAQSHKDNAKWLPTPPGALKTIVKLATPWHVRVPKDVKLMILPLSYSDTHEFEQVPGILDPGISSEINFLLRWYVRNGSYKIKAGTPIAHVIPITERSLVLECRDATPKDLKWVQRLRYLQTFSFAIQRKKIKEAYKSFWN